MGPMLNLTCVCSTARKGSGVLLEAAKLVPASSIRATWRVFVRVVLCASDGHAPDVQLTGIGS